MRLYLPEHGLNEEIHPNCFTLWSTYWVGFVGLASVQHWGWKYMLSIGWLFSVLFLPSLQESILSHVQRIVKGEVGQAMKEQQAVVTSSIMQAMRSAAGTPVPTAHLDYQTQQANILQLLQQGQLNQAFQQVMHIE